MTESVSDLFVKFAELKLTTVDTCSLANCTNDFLIGTVHRTAPIIIDNYNRFTAGKGDLTQMSAELLVLFPARRYRQKSLICTSTASLRSRKAVADPGGVQTPALLFRCPFWKRTYFENMSLWFLAKQGAS